MRVLIPVNDLQEGEESVTFMRVDFGDVSDRAAKRKFRKVLKEWEIPVRQHKRIIKEYFPNKK